MRNMYLIVLEEGNENNEATWGALREKWPGHHRFVDDRSAVLVPDDDSLTPDIKEALRIGPDAKNPGIVFKITNYSGYWDATLWEWIGKFE